MDVQLDFWTHLFPLTGPAMYLTAKYMIFNRRINGKNRERLSNLESALESSLDKLSTDSERYREVSRAVQILKGTDYTNKMYISSIDLKRVLGICNDYNICKDICASLR